VDVLTPRTLDEALRIKAERTDAVPIAGGTDLMVELNFDRARPDLVLDLGRLEELAGWSQESGSLRLGARVSYTELRRSPLRERLPALAEAARTVGSPQIQNRGTIGGNLGTASPAGDALPPLLVGAAEVVVASARGTREVALDDFLAGPKRTTLAADELILAVRVAPARGRQTFMKVGPRNAMVISVVSLALAVDEERGELRASFGSAGPVPGLVVAPLADRHELADLVATVAQPIDDVRGTAPYRRHALRVLAGRALERCLT
jgi:CO/xanthine dehydrogenase FAD-binding subunit